MEQKCGNCRFWGAEDDNTGTYRQCEAILCDEYGHAGTKVESWMQPKDLELHKKINAQKAVAVDASGFWAALRTRDDFGCVLWQSAQQTGGKDADPC